MMCLVENTYLLYCFCKFEGRVVEDQVFHLQKRGQLKVCPSQESDAVEYLVLDLNELLAGAEIYRRHIGQELETYEMRSA